MAAWDVPYAMRRAVATLAEIIAFPTPAPKDCGAKERNRARIAGHRNGQNFGRVIGYDDRDSLTQDHADPEDTAPCEYVRPADS
jgi:hypothetical protein